MDSVKRDASDLLQLMGEIRAELQVLSRGVAVLATKLEMREEDK